MLCFMQRQVMTAMVAALSFMVPVHLEAPKELRLVCFIIKLVWQFLRRQFSITQQVPALLRAAAVFLVMIIKMAPTLLFTAP